MLKVVFRGPSNVG